jgi:hypothetical protein
VHYDTKRRYDCFTYAISQSLVKVVNRTCRHFAYGVLFKTTLHQLFKLQLGVTFFFDFTMHPQQLLFQRSHTSIDGSKKCTFRDFGKTRQLTVGAREARSKCWCKRLQSK